MPKYKVTIWTYWEKFSVIQQADNKAAAKYRVFKYLKKIGWFDKSLIFIDYLKLFVEGCEVYD